MSSNPIPEPIDVVKATTTAKLATAQSELTKATTRLQVLAAQAEREEYYRGSSSVPQAVVDLVSTLTARVAYLEAAVAGLQSPINVRVIASDQLVTMNPLEFDPKRHEKLC